MQTIIPRKITEEITEEGPEGSVGGVYFWSGVVGYDCQLEPRAAVMVVAGEAHMPAAANTRYDGGRFHGRQPTSSCKPANPSASTAASQNPSHSRPSTAPPSALQLGRDRAPPQHTPSRLPVRLHVNEGSACRGRGPYVCHRIGDGRGVVDGTREQQVRECAARLHLLARKPASQERKGEGLRG